MSFLRATPCSVFMDESIPEGTVELSSDVVKKRRLKPGDPVVIRRQGEPVSVRTSVSEELGKCQMAMHPLLATYLGAMEGDTVDVGDTITVQAESGGGVRSFEELLESDCEVLRPLLGDALSDFKGMKVRDVLDHIHRYGGTPSGRYLVVGPNQEGAGIPFGEACEDPSLAVKEWHPDE